MWPSTRAASGGTHYGQVVTVPLSSSAVQAAVTLKVLSTGKRVEVDGLGAFVGRA